VELIKSQWKANVHSAIKGEGKRLEEQQRKSVSVLVNREGSIQIQGLPLDNLMEMLELVKDIEVEIEAEPCPVKDQKEKGEEIPSNIMALPLNLNRSVKPNKRIST